MGSTPDVVVEQEWTVATGKSASRRNRRRQFSDGSGTRQGPLVENHGKVESQPTEKQIAQYMALVHTAKEEVRRSVYWNHVLKTLEHECGDIHWQKMIVWGLGSLEQPGAYTIRCQLGLALVVRDSVAQDCSIELYDPVFTALDKAVLHRLCECQIPDTNSDGATVIDTPTLMYMPHCEGDLTLRFLDTNAAHGTLGNIVMIGNSLRAYHERAHMMKGQDLWSHLMPLHKEIPLPEFGFDCPGAFNNLSLHIFI